MVSPEDIIDVEVEMDGLKRDTHKTTKKRVADWLAMRFLEPDLTTAECAKRMGINPSTLYTHINRATKAGWLRFNDPLSRIEHEIIPKTLDNIKMFLDEGDKQVTIETAKATVFRQFQESKVAAPTNLNVLSLKIELAPGVTLPSIEMTSNHVVGKPIHVIDVIDVEPES